MHTNFGKFYLSYVIKKNHPHVQKVLIPISVQDFHLKKELIANFLIHHNR